MSDNNSHKRQSYPGVMISGTENKPLFEFMSNELEAHELHPVQMKDEGEKIGNVLDNSLAMVHRSSGFISIIGLKYGRIPEKNNPDNKSLIELEYDVARAKNIPMKVLIMEDDYPDAEVELDDSKKKKLDAFKRKIKEEEDIYTTFGSFHDFELKAIRVAQHIQNAIKIKAFNDQEQEREKETSKIKVPPVYTQIRNRSPQDLVEFRFAKLLKPVLSKLKKLLNVRELAIGFLSERDGSMIPKFPPGFNYNEYKKINEELLKKPNRFREHKLSKAILIKDQDNVNFYDGDHQIPPYYKSSVRFLSKVVDWIGSEICEQVPGHLKMPNKQPVVCSLKYVPSLDNRDVIGYIIASQSFREYDEELNEREIGEMVQQIVEDELLPILRYLLLETTRTKLQPDTVSPSMVSRSSILNTILEAAVSLSGADWGCIKSSTLGASSMDVSSKECELVQAVCVHNCPRFFHEGKLVDTEELVAYSVRKNEDMVLNLNADTRKTFNHPATQMAVYLIRDPDEVIEPRLLNINPDIVGALVVQHTASDYLTKFEKLYSPYLQELANLTSQTVRAAASRSLVPLLKKTIAGDSTCNITATVSDIVDWVASGERATWVLLEPRHGRLKATHSSDDNLNGLQNVLLDIVGVDQPVHQQHRLAAFVCNSTLSLRLQDFNQNSMRIKVERAGLTETGAYAYYDDRYPAEIKILQEDARNRVVFDLGARTAWDKADLRDPNGQKVALVIGPIVAPTGIPVGVLAVMREIDIERPPWTPKELREFERELSSLSDDLYISYLKQILNK